MPKGWHFCPFLEKKVKKELWEYKKAQEYCYISLPELFFLGDFFFSLKRKSRR